MFIIDLNTTECLYSSSNIKWLKLENRHIIKSSIIFFFHPQEKLTSFRDNVICIFEEVFLIITSRKRKGTEH